VATRTTADRTSPAVTVACADCGATYELAVRNELAHRRSGKPHRCRTCRGLRGLPTPSEEDKQFWINMLGLDEARAVAGMIWP
jgi:hypothetical protein